MKLKKIVMMTALSSVMGTAPTFAKPVFQKPGRQCGQFQKPGAECGDLEGQDRQVCIAEVQEHNRKVAECLRNRHGVSPVTFDLLFSDEESN